MPLPLTFKSPTPCQLHRGAGHQPITNCPRFLHQHQANGSQLPSRHVWCRSHQEDQQQPEPTELVNCSSEEHTDESELPEALRGLSINDQGFLVDEKSGKVVNSLGATRFDVAVSAMRGMLDPPAWVENTEQTSGLILGSLFQFPRKHVFSVVGQNTMEFQLDVINTIQRVCQAELDKDTDVRAVERLGGKFISMQVEAMVRAPEIVTLVWEELGKDKRVKMRY